jgi:hypothetical protein
MNAMRHYTKLFVLAALGVAAASCGDVARSGRSPMFLMIDELTAVRGGGEDKTPTHTLISDVLTIVTKPDPCSKDNPCPTVFNDMAQVTFHLSQKDITSVVGPTSNNQVTINRYRVAYRRSDGRSTPGVDVPYGFDSGLTVTVPATGKAEAGFELVRHTSKEESPLVQLIDNPTIISTIAEVTFYGQDTVGNEIQATATIGIDFGNFGDR